MATLLKFFHYSKHLISGQNFCANHSAFDRYVSGPMQQHESDNVTRNYVGLDERGLPVSLFCLSASRVRRDEHEKLDKIFPSQMDLPTIKIGRLVVHKDHRDSGYGKQTLTKAIALFIESSKLIGTIGLTVDAKDEVIVVGGKKKHVYEFYEKYGFKRLTQEPENNVFPMILYISTVRKMFPALFETPV